MPSFDPIAVKGDPINVSTDANPALEDNESYYLRNKGPNDIEFLPEDRTAADPTADNIVDRGFTLSPGNQFGFTDDSTDYIWVVAPAGSELRVARAVVP